jgi:hypothetical protein
MKTVLIAKGAIHPQREIVFLPSGGHRGVQAVVPIVAGKDEELPLVLLDSDEQGREFAKKLRSGKLYGQSTDRELAVGDLIGIENAEVEDLIPFALMLEAVTRLLRGESDFQDSAQKGKPIVPQIEAYAARCGVDLAKGWKVDLARFIKQRLIKGAEIGESIDLWKSLFAKAEPKPIAARLDAG